MVYLLFRELDGILRCVGYSVTEVYSDKEIVRVFDEKELSSLEPNWREGLWSCFILSADGALMKESLRSPFDESQ